MVGQRTNDPLLHWLPVSGEPLARSLHAVELDYDGQHRELAEALYGASSALVVPSLVGAAVPLERQPGFAKAHAHSDFKLCEGLVHE